MYITRAIRNELLSQAFQQGLTLFVFLIVVFLSISAQVDAQSMTKSFNTTTGQRDVNYAGYLSKHDLVYRRSIADRADGIPVGTGKVGALIYDQGSSVKLHITGVDASPHTMFASGRVAISANPPLPSVNIERRLSLHDGTAIIKNSSNNNTVKMTVFGDPNSELLAIKVEDPRVGSGRSYTIDLDIWDNSIVNCNGGGGFPPGDPSSWSTATTGKETNPENPVAIALSRGQSDPNNYGYTMRVNHQNGSKGGSPTVNSFVLNSTAARLVIYNPSPDFTIWIAVASRVNATGYNSEGAAFNIIGNARRVGASAILNSFTGFWHSFWSKSFVQYSSTSADARTDYDYLENLWYLHHYVVASASRGKNPFHFMAGVHRFNEDCEGNPYFNPSFWTAGYWHFNQRISLFPLLASNHAEFLDSYHNFYKSSTEDIKAITLRKFSGTCENQTCVARPNKSCTCDADCAVEGMWTPEVLAFDGLFPADTGTVSKELERLSIRTPFVDQDYNHNRRFQPGSSEVLYNNPNVENIMSSGAEVAEWMWKRYLFTNDQNFLANTAYPYMKETVKFYKKWLQLEDGVYKIKGANAQENWHWVTNPVPDIAAVRYLFSAAKRAAIILNDTDASFTSDLSTFITKTAPFAVGPYMKITGEIGTKYLPCSTVIDEYKVGEFGPNESNCENLYDDVDLGTPWESTRFYGPYNLQTPELEMLFPHGVIGAATSSNAYKIAKDTYLARANYDRDRSFGTWKGSNYTGSWLYFYDKPTDILIDENPWKLWIWSQDAIYAARLGLRDDVTKILKRMALRNNQFRNGIPWDGNARFDSIGVNATAINESLLQSHDYHNLDSANGSIRVFVSPPSDLNAPLDDQNVVGSTSDVNFNGAFTLAAEGGFLVSSERESGKTKYVGIKSLAGKQATVSNPFDGEEFRVREVSGRVVAGPSKTWVAFPTTLNWVYIVERTATDRKFNDYMHITKTGTPNNGEKSISIPATNGKFFSFEKEPYNTATPEYLQLTSLTRYLGSNAGN
ncbi:glycosyl hydrolase family 95 catalytic domain-containing protein [Candidatus Cyanaurora vandensis]|uniref:glycosyl hydrolase family 95 catalytic domain-containing protein n=1 Tax=Candidatus Cyanaurora vandensis TaxID=2714958 RepID=UPI00257C4640|nr:hypothetical protein [Candidatus Cyanaurora vandensis]